MLRFVLGLNPAGTAPALALVGTAPTECLFVKFMHHMFRLSIIVHDQSLLEVNQAIISLPVLGFSCVQGWNKKNNQKIYKWVLLFFFIYFCLDLKESAFYLL